MPIYPSTPSFRFYFHNNVVANGRNDREYTAKDMRKPYDTIYSDGVKPDADGTAGNELKVTAAGGMAISVAKGCAKVGGAYCENESAYNITLDAAGSADRYDCVIVQNDDNDNVRDGNIYIKPLSAKPTVANLTRSGGIYELCIAYVHIPAFAMSVTDTNITDTREDGQLCNVMSGVGASVVRTFRNTVYSERAGQTGVTIGIPQFDRTRDTLTVIVNGRVLPASGYTIPSNTYVELALGLSVIGTRVDFVVTKSVNAKGAESVVQEVAFLQNEMAAVNKTLEHHYYCNGQTDNVNISNLVTNFQNGYTDYSSVRLVIHGTFGATSPRGGEGTADNAYYWIRAAQGGNSSRKVILDFTDCRQISINCTEGTNNIIFFGMDCIVVGANVVASGGDTITMFSTSGATTVYAENCRFWVTCNSGGYIARSGTFKNCRATVTNAGLHSYCFVPIAASLLRIEGGEYYAYTGSSEHMSAVVGLTSGATAVAVLFGVNAPTTVRGGYRQTHAIYQTTGKISCAYLVSELPIQELSGSASYNGTIALNKPGMM